MAVVVLVLVLVAYGFVLVSYPELRSVALGVGGAAVAGLGAYFWLTEPEDTQSGGRIAREEVVLDRVEVVPSLRGATLTGRVRNGSPSYRLREMTLVLRLRDCPELAGSDDCPVIAESTAIARPDVPPAQVRAFQARFIFAPQPVIEGTGRWEWDLVDVRAVPVGGPR
jgi:hypothetical protein